jgi:protein gp37
MPEKLDEPLRWRAPQRVFVNSMSDLFHEGLPRRDVAAVMGVMSFAWWHTFQVLTKRAARMAEMMTRLTLAECQAEAVNRVGPDAIRRLVRRAGPSTINVWPIPNLWMGVSVESQEYAGERIPRLLQTPAAVRFVSYEPALGPVDFGRWMGGLDVSRDGDGDDLGSASGGSDLDWVIVGGESGPLARPFDIQWARSTVEQCRSAGVACFVKQLGAVPYDSAARLSLDGPDSHAVALDLADPKGGDPAEWDADLRVREFPAARLEPRKDTPA